MHRGYTFLWRKTWSNPILQEKGKRFSRIEAWLNLTNVLAAGVDDPTTGNHCGEFQVSVRRLASIWNWSPAAVFRFLRLLEEDLMISRLKHQAEHQAEQEAERFTVCNYSAYNPERNTKRNAERNVRRNRYKEGIKEGLNAAEKDTPPPADAGKCVSPVIAAASRRAPYHLFGDDIDKLKLTDCKTEVLFDLVDSLYRQKHGLTVTGNYSMPYLVERERMHPAIVRRLDDMCRVVEV